MRRTQQHLASKGSIVIYLVAVMAVLGVLSLATTGFFSSSTVGTARTNCPVLAQYLAEAGTRYAISEIRAESTLADITTTGTTLSATTYTVTDAGTFNPIIGAPVDSGGGFYTVTIACTGTACTASGGVTHTNAATTVLTNVPTITPPEEINFEDTAEGGESLDDFNIVGEGGEGGDNIIQINTDDNLVALGNGELKSYACIWYGGNKSPCTDGDCSMGSGFRAYFEVWIQGGKKKELKKIGDGFTFAIASCDTNDNTACGGYSDRGELLAYAGPGTSGNGIQPPKLAIEFDLVINNKKSSPCVKDSRNDFKDAGDHLAWVYWGDDQDQSSCDHTFDDNRHGEGDLTDTEPRNPENWSKSYEGFDGYYYELKTKKKEKVNKEWLRGYNTNKTELKKFLVRIELDREETANGAGNYCYTLKAWIKKDEDTIPADYDNLLSDFYNPSQASTAPSLSDSFVLNQAMHNLMDEVQFGWTVATSKATTNIEISEFKLQFRSDTESCTDATMPTDYVAAYSMYEGAGNTLDDLSDNDNDGTITGATWVTGKGCPACSGLLMNADSGGQVEIPDSNSLDLENTGTISTWIYLNDYTNWGGIVHKGENTDGSDEAYSLQFSRNNATLGASYNISPAGKISDGQKKPLFCIRDVNGDRDCVTATTELETDTWCHVVATWDSGAAGDDMILYINGTAEPDPLANMLYNIISSSGDLSIGAQFSDGSYPFDGIVDEVYIYDRQLTPAEVLTLYNDGLRQP